MFGGVLVIFIILSVLTSFFGVFKKGVHPSVAPLWSVTEFLEGSITEGLLSLHSKKALIQKFLRMQEDFMALSPLVLEHRVLTEENKKLRELLALKDASSYSLVAEVVTRPPHSVYDTIVIGKGSSSGVTQGDLVFAGERTLLGIVSEVYGNTSLVQLLSSPGVLSSSHMSDSDITLTLTGKGGGGFYVEVPRDLELGEHGLFLSDIDGSVIAEVVDIKMGPQDPIKKVIARAPAYLEYIQYVFIKKP